MPVWTVPSKEAEQTASARADGWLREGLWTLGFALLLALAAQVRFYPAGNPVPVTMQTAAVLLCGFWLRPRLAVAAVLVYLALGYGAALGTAPLPFFAALKIGGSTATLGYLVGFVPAAGLVSLLSRSLGRMTLGRAAAVGLLGTLVIFLFGVTWLALLTGSLESAIQHGLLPFVIWALAKVGVVASLVQIGGLVRGR